MKYLLIFSLFSLKVLLYGLYPTNSSYAKADIIPFKNFTKEYWKLNKNQLKKILNHKVLSDASVDSESKKQEFSMRAMALHPKKCTKVLRKLSMFENYSKWISFVKSSVYNEKAKLLTVKADHFLLPFPMVVHIFMDRPTKKGVYPFKFPTGIFTGLTGELKIQEFNKQCFLYAQSDWKGKNTKIPGFIIEIFSETLSRIAGEMLIRKTMR